MQLPPVMRLKLLRLFFIGAVLVLSNNSKAQNFSFNCSRDTILPGCPPGMCFTLKAIIPDIHGQTNTYSLNPGSFNSICNPVYVAPNDPAGTSTNLSIDDRYSAVINMGFPFPFYGTIYNDLVASTNGYLSFDISLATGFSHYQNFGDLPNGAYDRALIMGPYHDLDPSVSASPTKKIQYQVWGVAPHRRWVLSFYKVPLYSAACNSLFENTHQIILYESTGIFEVKIFDKQICFSWQGGKSMVGIQNFARTQGMTAPNRKMSDPAWGSIGLNETWRFVPNSGPSLLKRVELFDLLGNLISTGTTAPLISGCLDVSFPNVCAPAGATTSYVVKSVYEKIDDPTVEIFGTDTVRVDRAQTLTGVVNTSPANCGTSNGTITVTGVSGGTPPYEYSLDGISWQTSNVFSGLAPGVYTVRIRDFGAVCNYTAPPVTVGVTGNISVTTTTTPTACIGSNTGKITINTATGTGPYTFSLDGGPFLPGVLPYTFNNVSSGSHTVIVDDLGTGCNSGPITVTVNAGPGTDGFATSTPTTCSGNNDGTITVTATLGTAPFTWSLDGGPFQNGANPYTFTNVAAGPNHLVTIKDNFGCSHILFPINVAAGSTLTATTTSTPTACATATNGSITITSASGTAPYTFTLDGGPPQSGSIPFTFNNVTSGNHTIVVTDVTNCSSPPITVTVNAGPGVSGNATTTATSCPTATNGSITVTATAGTPPFTWSLDGGPPQNGASPYTFSNVAAGTHNILITDNFGCTLPINNIVVAAGSALTATTTSTPTACATAANGSITITSANGTAPYTFTIDGGPPQGGPIPFTFNNVTSGNHTIIVTDVTGCSSPPIIVTVNAGPGVSGNATTAATSCPTATNGSITVTATAGTPPFTWSLDGGPPQNGANPYTFNNVAAGIHNILITDNFGCNLPINNVVVNAGPVLSGTTSATPTSCNGASNGSITVSPVGGIAPFTFALDGGPPQSGTAPYTFNNVPAGPHTVVIADAVGCVSNPIPQDVIAGPMLTTTYTATDVLCNGGATGIITVTVPVMGNPPYEYSLDNINWQFNNSFNGLAAGTYTVYFRESSGCPGSLQAIVSEPAVLNASLVTVPVVCNGQNDGTITITTTGGVPPYQYSIDGGANWQGSNVFNVSAGFYTIITRDNNNCTTPQSITVTEPAAISASTVNTDASCNGGNDGTITVTASGGNGGYQYSIDGTNFQGSNVFNVAPGTYTVTVKDNLGCIKTTPATVGLGNNLTYIKQTDATICEGTSTQLLFTSNATVYSWSPSNGLSNTSIPNPVANPTVTTEYFVTATLGGCVVEDTVFVNVNPAPVPDAGPPGIICFGQTYQLQASGGVQYLWTPSTYLDNPSVPNPISSAAKTIIYTLSVISDINGCASLVTDDVMVDVTPPIKVNTFPYDTIGYPGDLIQLQAISVVPAANIYTWTPSTNLNNPNIPNPVVTSGNVGDVTIYKVTATSAAGCKGEGYVRFRVFKGPELYTPTGFTPNGDGLNDIFYPFPVGIKSINYFKVFNRWGQLVFSSQTLYKGWDGKIGGVDQPTGVYVYMAEGVDKNNNVLTRRGNVTLIR